MATAKKKTTRAKSGAAKVTWTDTIKNALKNKQPPGGWPDQGKPRDTTVKKVKKDAY